MKSEKPATSQTHNVATRTIFVVIINVESLPIASGQNKILDLISALDNSTNVRWPTTVTAKSNSEQENKIQKNKLKLLPANYKHSRQKQKQVTLSRIRHNKSKLLTAKTNCLRQKQIAHGKSQNGGQRFLVSGSRSTWCNFLTFFGNVVIMFCSKCGCSLKEIDNFCSSCGKGKFSHFYNHFFGVIHSFIRKIQRNFHVAHVLCVCVL